MPVCDCDVIKDGLKVGNCEHYARIRLRVRMSGRKSQAVKNYIRNRTKTGRQFLKKIQDFEYD